MRTLDKNNQELKKGDLIKDFRGEVWTFISATRSTDEAHSGKVYVGKPDEEFGGREFYASVFDLTVQE